MVSSNKSSCIENDIQKKTKQLAEKAFEESEIPVNVFVDLYNFLSIHTMPIVREKYFIEYEVSMYNEAVGNPQKESYKKIEVRLQHLSETSNKSKS